MLVCNFVFTVSTTNNNNTHLKQLNVSSVKCFILSFFFFFFFILSEVWNQTKKKWTLNIFPWGFDKWVYLYLQHIIQPVIQHRPKYLVYTLFFYKFYVHTCVCSCAYIYTYKHTLSHPYCCCSEVIKIVNIKKIATTAHSYSV